MPTEETRRILKEFGIAVTQTMVPPGLLHLLKASALGLN